MGPVSILVTGQPIGWVLCGWQAQADRHRWRIGAGTDKRFGGPAAARGAATARSSLPLTGAARSFVFPKAVANRSLLPRLEVGQRRITGYSAIPARRPSLPFLQTQAVPKHVASVSQFAQWIGDASSYPRYRLAGSLCFDGTPALRPSRDVVCAELRSRSAGADWKSLSDRRRSAELRRSGERTGVRVCRWPTRVSPRPDDRRSAETVAVVRPVRPGDRERRRPRPPGFGEPCTVSRWPARRDLAQDERERATFGCSTCGGRVPARLTSDAALDNSPVWSPDGARIVFSSNRKGVLDLYQTSADGVGSEDQLLATAQAKSASDWSRDGRFLLYTSAHPRTRGDIWALPMKGDHTPFPVVADELQ